MRRAPFWKIVGRLVAGVGVDADGWGLPLPKVFV